MERMMRTSTFQTGPRGLALELCHWGPTEGTPLLVLHGFLEQGAAWHDVAQHLPYPIVAPDHRGHGRSEHVGRGGYYHFWDYVADVDALVRHLGGQVHLVGHSMGGTIASLYAATRPDAVRSLVLVEGLGPPDMTHTALGRAHSFLHHHEHPRQHPAFATVAEAAKRMQRFNPNLADATAMRLAERMVRPVATDDPVVKDPRPGMLTWRWDPMHRSRAPVPFRADLHHTYLAAIQAPTLLVSGETSVWQLPDHDLRAASIPEATHTVVPHAGHLVHLDAPQALAQLVHAHIEAIP